MQSICLFAREMGALSALNGQVKLHHGAIFEVNSIKGDKLSRTEKNETKD